MRNRIVPALLVAGVIFGAHTAAAQSITLGSNTTIRRKFPIRPLALKPYWVNQYDCRNHDVLTFSATLSGYSSSSMNLEVWAGTAKCTDIGQRQAGSTAQCWRVFFGTPSQPVQDVPVFARNIVARNLPVAGQTGGSIVPEADETVCEGQTANQALSLYFMLTDSAGNIMGNGSAVWTDGGYDVAPPAPPSGVTSGAGENSVHLAWTRSTDSDILGYTIYCDPGGSLLSDAGSSTANFGGPFGLLALDGSAVFADSGAVGTGGAGGASSGAGGATGAGGTTTTLDAGTILDAGLGDASTVVRFDAGIGSCAPTILTPGSDATKVGKFACGYSAGITANSGTAKGLENGHEYVVAVAAQDTVGNVGVLSNDVCSTPVQITDFFELYKQYGGKGGGGFCSMSHRTSGGAGATFGILAAVGASVLRRRRRPTA
ncbi:MAG TPA: hypothetical protein VHE30_03715 [Polyangiaceae bacterium]|nr:hypothetical protein [Polyangiaceae bacterium]